MRTLSLHTPHICGGPGARKYSRRQGHVNYNLQLTLWHLIYPNPWQLVIQASSVKEAKAGIPLVCKNHTFHWIFLKKWKLISASLLPLSMAFNYEAKRPGTSIASPRVSPDSLHSRASNASIQLTGDLEFLKSFEDWVVVITLMHF